MYHELFGRHQKSMRLFLYMSLLVLVSACGSAAQPVSPSPQTHLPTPGQSTVPTTPPIVSPTPVITPTGGGANAAGALTPTATDKTGHPVLAFYYPWYTATTWCSCTMSDLPTIEYKSSDTSTIARQLAWAAAAGITGFISSWWGPGDVTDQNFAKLLAQAATLESASGYHFASTIYFESDSPSLGGIDQVTSALRYIIAHYSADPHFFHWHGKPVLFIWDPLGEGRTLDFWNTVRSQVDPTHALIWSAEGTQMSLLTVFDGLHLFSAAYWGIEQGDIGRVDQGFRAAIDAYNQAHATQKIWAAGVLPGYDDTRVPGRQGTYVVPRNTGATYRASWMGALASNPDWITITSFNEWFEGSMIEPSIHYGTLYLDLTQQFTRQWQG